jgi:hypothetical protein
VTDDRSDDQPGWAAPGSAPGEPGPWDTPAVAPPGAPPPPAGWGQQTAPGAAVPAVPPPQAAAGAPRRRRGKGWLVALLVTLGAIVAIAIAGTVLFVTRTLPPYRGADDVLSAVRRGDDNAARNRLCSADRVDESAIRVIRDTMNDSKSVTVNAFGVDRSGSTARVEFTVTYNGGKRSRSYHLPMVEENGSWKACPP